MSKTQGKPGKPAVKPGANTDEVKAEAAKIIADAKAATAASNAGKRIKAPLEGITVLDLGLAISGPFGTQLLSDLGATVIKLNGLYAIFWPPVPIATRKIDVK